MPRFTTDLRDATARDAAAIARVYVETTRAQYRGIVRARVLSRVSVNRVASRWESLLTSSRWLRSVHLAEDERHVVGFVGAGPVRRAGLPSGGENYAIYVLSGAQRQGLGRLLFDRAARSLADQGFDSLLVQVFAFNPTRGFFEALGGRWAGLIVSQARNMKIAYRWDRFPALARRVTGWDRSAPARSQHVAGARVTWQVLNDRSFVWMTVCAAIAIGVSVVSGRAQTDSTGIRPLDQDSFQTAIRDGEDGRVLPSSPFALRLDTIRNGKASEDPIGPMDETGLRNVEARAPFMFVVLSPYLRVALAAAQARTAGEPRPDQPLGDLNAQGVTVRVSPGPAFATADAVERVSIDKGDSTWHPIQSRVSPRVVEGQSREGKQLTEGEFDFPLEVFEPSAPITLTLEGRTSTFRWTITRSELARLK